MRFRPSHSLPAWIAALLLACAATVQEPPASRDAPPTPRVGDVTAPSGRLPVVDPDSESVATASASGPLWIEVDTPSEGERVRSPLPLLELRGRIGRGERGVYDLVIALDRSQSSLLPSGIDLDGDGRVAALRGRRDRDVYRGVFERWTTDYDDVVVWGELEAARRLLAGLHPTRARVAVLAFSGEARTLAPLGSVAEARAALDAFEPRLDLTGTSFAGAIEEGLDVLMEAPGDPRPRRAVVLITSDGIPTAPLQRHGAMPGRLLPERLAKRRAEREARASADRARTEDVAVYAFEVRNEADDDPGLLAEISEAAAGRYVYVHDPSELRFELPNESAVAPASIEVENRTSKEPGRAVRIFANGEFDAFVPLAPGENLLGVRAVLEDGTELALERSVFFEKPARAYPSDTRRLEVVLEELQRRTEETRALPRSPAEPTRERDVRVEPE